jgi:hypothetical protein
VVIVDNLFEKTSHIIMADDGHGASIHIPSIFISKVDGDQIVDYLKSQSSVLTPTKVVGVMIFNDTLK